MAKSKFITVDQIRNAEKVFTQTQIKHDRTGSSFHYAEVTNASCEMMFKIYDPSHKIVGRIHENGFAYIGD